VFTLFRPSLKIEKGRALAALGRVSKYLFFVSGGKDLTVGDFIRAVSSEERNAAW
jgi:hypothetical protein